MCKPVKDGEGQEALEDCGSCGCSLSEASSRGPHNGPRVSFREKGSGPYNTYRVGTACGTCSAVLSESRVHG